MENLSAEDIGQQTKFKKSEYKVQSLIIVKY